MQTTPIKFHIFENQIELHQFILQKINIDTLLK